MPNEDEVQADTQNSEVEVSEPKEEVVTLSKAEFEKLNQTLGSLKRENKDLKKPKDEPKETSRETKVEGLDRLDKLFLRQEGIKSQAEMDLVEDLVKETGKSVEQIVDSKYFQSQLKDLRDSIATKEATPSGTKRSGQTARDEVDYWVSKGELPKDNPELARKVVNAKLNKAKNVNQFSDTPVIS